MTLARYIKDIREKGQRSFTLRQLMFDLGLSKNAAWGAIHRLKSQGDLISPARGFYIVVPPEHQPVGCIPPEELIPLLMEHLQADYYVSLLSAGLYHGASHQKPRYFQVISNKRLKHSLRFGYIEIELIYKKSLAGLPIQNRSVHTGYLKMATPELVALDLFLYPMKSGGLNHIATVLYELVEAMDADRLIALAEISGEKAWLQRLGYILEQLDTMEPEKTKIIIDRLEQYLHDKIKAFIPLAPEISTVGFPRLKKWMIIENTNIESDL